MSMGPFSSEANPAPGVSPTIVVQSGEPSWLSRWRVWGLTTLLIVSLAFNFMLYALYREYFAADEGPTEKYHSEDKAAATKIAIIRVSGTIMPPYTGRILKAIKRAKDDNNVKAVLLVVNSPGGFVADSHQIYHRLKELRETTKKPIYVSMENMAASGGYYIAMGAGPEGKIFAEPTTWTGSIGVILPHYEAHELAEKVGVTATPLTTGKFKDSLSPFKPLSPDDVALWSNIIDQSYEQFLDVIASGRANLKKDRIRELATGQIYTAKDARSNGLIDEIGYIEDAVAALKKKLQKDKVRVIQYEFPVTVLDLLTAKADSNGPREQWNALLEASIPRAMYFCSWGGPLPPAH